MGRKIVLTGTTLTDLTAPKLADIDLILPEAGALLLLDPTHPHTSWPVGKPADGAVLPNVAYDQAKALIPAGTTASLGASISIGDGFEDDGVGSRMERTGKNALHVILSQASSGTKRSVSILGGNSLANYIAANKDHSFFTAFWGQITRPPSGTGTTSLAHSRVSANFGIAYFYHRLSGTGTTEYPEDATRLGAFRENAAPVANGSIYQDVAVSDGSATTTVPLEAWIRIDGLAPGKGASMIFYGFYMEDLTVSGRTYAEVHELARAKYERDVKTPGGRYYGDTFTDPATIP